MASLRRLDQEGSGESPKRAGPTGPGTLGPSCDAIFPMSSRRPARKDATPFELHLFRAIFEPSNGRYLHVKHTGIGREEVAKTSPTHYSVLPSEIAPPHACRSRSLTMHSVCCIQLSGQNCPLGLPILASCSNLSKARVVLQFCPGCVLLMPPAVDRSNLGAVSISFYWCFYCGCVRVRVPYTERRAVVSHVEYLPVALCTDYTGTPVTCDRVCRAEAGGTRRVSYLLAKVDGVVKLSTVPVCRAYRRPAAFMNRGMVTVVALP